ncbi:diaminopimelate epimerase [Martelella endophytica]|uniref:Diaminopimelate epimerase n=1 Tax=Martelella endophytica TaxID=1486262 RepID=A0A0D5LR05_MAREN|nr:diaminopimelate epimerase [Martelella endophytica]AJY45778.1 diaminopimelate epimerase [Martelella endophytica]
MTQTNDKAPMMRMNGLGNKILVIDMRGRQDKVTPQAAIRLNAHPDTAFDQIMALYDPRDDAPDGWIDILNSDGSMAQACGNGTRCVVDYLNAASGQTRFAFRTIAGSLLAERHGDGLISVDMGPPEFEWEKIPLAGPAADTKHIALAEPHEADPALQRFSAASMGNPHAVFFVPRDVDSYDILAFGPRYEHHPMFPERANISLAQVTSPSSLSLKTFERGAGLTLACGSAACAAAVSAARTGRTGRKVTVYLPAGALEIDWREDNDHVVMTGPAVLEWRGAVEPATGEWERL